MSVELPRKRCCYPERYRQIYQGVGNPVFERDSATNSIQIISAFRAESFVMLRYEASNGCVVKKIYLVNTLPAVYCNSSDKMPRTSA